MYNNESESDKRKPLLFFYGNWIRRGRLGMCSSVYIYIMYNLYIYIYNIVYRYMQGGEGKEAGMFM